MVIIERGRKILFQQNGKHQEQCGGKQTFTQALQKKRRRLRSGLPHGNDSPAPNAAIKQECDQKLQRTDPKHRKNAENLFLFHGTQSPFTARLHRPSSMLAESNRHIL